MTRVFLSGFTFNYWLHPNTNKYSKGVSICSLFNAFPSLSILLVQIFTVILPVRLDLTYKADLDDEVGEPDERASWP